MRLLRLVAAPLVLAASGLAAALVAAGGCSSSSGSSAPADASADGSLPPLEAGGDDGPSLPDVDAGPPIVFPRIYLTNASADAPLLRFCLGFGAPGEGGAVVVAGGQPAWPDQAPDTRSLAGLGVGTAVLLDDHGVDLDTLTVDVIAVNASNPQVVAASAPDAATEAGLIAPCEALVGYDGLGSGSDAGLVPGRDYWDLGTIPMGALGHGTTRLAAVTGCIPGETRAPALCPAGYDATAGDSTLTTWQLDTTTPVAAGALGAQFAQASSELDDLARASGGVTSAGFVLPGDAGTVTLAGDAGLGTLQPQTLAQVPGLTFDGSSSFFVQYAGADGGAVAPTPLSWTLPTLPGLSWPGAVPDAGSPRDGAGFVFVFVGDPLAPVGNGHTAQVLALPLATF